MKKLMILILSFVAVLSISACKKNDNNETNNEGETDSSNNDTNQNEQTKRVSSESFIYELLDDGTYEVSDIVDLTIEEYIVPSSYKGIPVTSIGNNAFTNADAISIVIPEGIKTIKNAFSGCSELEYLSIPNSVEDMNEVDLYDIPNLKLKRFGNAYYIGNENNPYNVLVKGFDKEITEVSIHKQTKIICGGAFSNYLKLETVKIPLTSKLTCISNDAFYYCKKLKQFTMINSVKYIGSYAFGYCYELEGINIPDSIEVIRSNAFNGTSNLYTTYNNGVYLGTSANPYHCFLKPRTEIVEGITIHKDTKMIADNACGNYYTALLNVNFEQGIELKSIGASAFYNCDGLTSFVCPDSVEVIGKSAFEQCSSLSDLTLSDNLISYGADLFKNCPLLNGIEYGGINYIKSNTNPYFMVYKASNSVDVTSVTIPNKTRFIYEKSFLENENITSIQFEDNSNLLKIDKRAFKDSAIESISIPSSVERINMYAFSGSKVSSLNFEDGSNLQYIGDAAFEDCDNLTKLIMPESVKDIGGSLFSNCSNLKTAKLSSNLSNLEGSTFYYCTALETVELPESFEIIGISCFYNCGKLTNVVMPNNLKIVDDSAFCFCRSLGDFSLPEGLEYIGGSAFYDCQKITTLIIPSTIKVLNDGIASGCSQLKTLVIPNSIEKIDNHCFSGCYSLETLNEYGNVKYLGNEENPYIIAYMKSDKSITEATIHKDTKFLHSSVFSECNNLESVSFENLDNIKYIGASAFYATAIKTFEMPKNITTIEYSTFARCKSLESVKFSDNITFMDRNSFHDCDLLTTIEIPGSVDTIGDYCFSSCDSLKSVKLNEGLVNLYKEAFSDCISLESITIPNSVKSIYLGAFMTCKSLKSVFIPNSVVSIGTDVFSGCISLEAIYIDRTEENLKKISGYNGLPLESVKCYVDCVHNLNQWTYVDGMISDEIHIINETVVESTCEVKGSVSGVCEICGGEINYSLKLNSHEYQDGSCIVCGKIDTGYDIFNDETYPFTVEGTSITSTNKEHSSESTYKIVATDDIIISFNYRTSCESSYDKLYIYLNGDQEVRASGQQTESKAYSATLSAGDILEICYSKDYSTSTGDDCIYITDFIVTKVE